MPFDANKLYCSEILAILIQNSDGKFQFNLTRDLFLRMVYFCFKYLQFHATLLIKFITRKLSCVTYPVHVISGEWGTPVRRGGGAPLLVQSEGRECPGPD